MYTRMYRYFRGE